MPSLKSKVLNFLKSFLIPAACEECAKHDRQYEISCETCVEAKKNASQMALCTCLTIEVKNHSK
jgi:hypothetical protein